MDKLQRVLELAKKHLLLEGQLAAVERELKDLVGEDAEPSSLRVSAEKAVKAAVNPSGTAIEKLMYVLQRYSGKEVSMEQLRNDLPDVHAKTLTATVSRMGSAGKIKNVGRGRYIYQGGN